ncbi:class I SAM-dependent methyltransferase [Geomicrobium sp. JCM 19039]|uniref:class I SAM-dependent methyltransferase n=1 Tax=Geomicrobium sp. JCM 19039 TaxID=1460636 RepID=UPI00045F3E3B|nr:methyltransferase [Geomicrobium sp. JCM 19039]GAK13844.1 ribosomal RNA small subunit methyltransferase C [Geomicrobium sp. JCM 19039]
MSSHYYDSKPTVGSERGEVSIDVNGERVTYSTDRGVFSKGEVDFGSRFLLETFVEPEVAGGVLDVGSGYGTLGIAIAKTGDRHVWMTDINERAVALSKENATKNKVDSQVTVVHGSVLERVPEDVRFAAAVTNPPIRAGKDVVHQIFEDVYRVLENGGELWVVIQKKQGAPSAKKKLVELFGDVEEVAKRKGTQFFEVGNKKRKEYLTGC